MLMEGVWNINAAGIIQNTQVWDKMMEGVSPALKAAGLGMIQSGEAFNIQQEAKLKEAAGWTPQQVAAGGATTVNISNSISVDKMASDLDIDKLTRDISTKITDSLKSYGIGG
jgi:hypothetical protein